MKSRNSQRVPRPLTELDIVISVYNQETLMPRVLEGVMTNTTTPFNLILIFDGCTDKSRYASETFIASHHCPLLKKLFIATADNVFETRANNIGFRNASTDYLITIQDDMIIEEKGWERRLTYPIRVYDDIFAVTSRVALTMDYLSDNVIPRYSNLAGREFWSLARDTFAIRNTINRGPIAFRTDILKQLQYLDEIFAPGQYDEADLVLRAQETYNMKCGAFSINYRSDLAWGKTRSSGNPITSRANTIKNATLLKDRHPQLSLETTPLLLENRKIHDSDIDYRGRDIFFRRATIHICASQRFFRIYLTRLIRKTYVGLKLSVSQCLPKSL